MASQFYNSAKKKLVDGSIDLDTDTIKVALLTSSYTPNIDSDDFFDDVSAYEVSSSGYSAGGSALANKSVTQDNTNDLAKFSADDVTWSAVTFTARYAVIYKSTGTAATSALIAVIDLLVNKSFSAEDATLTWSANGILTFA